MGTQSPAKTKVKYVFLSTLVLLLCNFQQVLKPFPPICLLLLWERYWRQVSSNFISKNKTVVKINSPCQMAPFTWVAPARGLPKGCNYIQFTPLGAYPPLVWYISTLCLSPHYMGVVKISSIEKKMQGSILCVRSFFLKWYSLSFPPPPITMGCAGQGGGG